MIKKKSHRKLIAPVLAMALLVPGIVPGMAHAAKDVKVQSMEFVGMAAPQTALDMARTYSSASVKVVYSDGSSKLLPLSYNTLYKSTDVINGMSAGTAVDVKGNPIMDNSVPGKPVPYVSDSPDSNSLMKIAGASPTGKGGNPLSLVTHFEYITKDNAGESAYGIIPASMSLSSIDQNKATGKLTVTGLNKIDFSAVDGLWIPCNGSLTPWNTHLGSEEYEPDARAYEGDSSKTYTSSFAKSYFQDDRKVGNPYAYGYIPEVTVNPDNTTSVVKHYSMGRFSHELGVVAPDNRTVIFGDDGGNTMLFMYVADKAQKLSAGTLYAAKWIQTSAENGGSANLQWIKLGHATDQEIKTYVTKGIKFSDIFETADKDTTGFTKIKAYPRGKIEWLKVKSGMEQAAAFLESRRYGAILGATSEFNKMEGVTVNAKDNKVYIAMSYIEKAMEKDAKGEDPADHIQVDKIKAGGTYELPMKGNQNDSLNNPIDSKFVPVSMSGLVIGEDLPKADEKGNTAVVDKVANPDNLTYSEQMRTLFIGEDSGMHANNYLWAYNVDTKKLSRILSVPAGAEATGLQVVDDLNGFAYIMSNLQHPGDEMIVPDPLKSEVESYINQNYDDKRSGMVGYLSGIPNLKKSLEWNGSNKGDVYLRDTATAKGATVEWNDAERSVTVTKDGNTLFFVLNESVVYVNQNPISLDHKIKVEKGRSLLPGDLLNEFLK